MSGHLPCTAMLTMSQHISTLNYLQSADTCLTRTLIFLVVCTCYNGQCKQTPRFWRSFQPKIAGAPPNLRSTVRSIFSVLPSGDHKQYFISRVNACVMNHVILSCQPTPLATFVLRHHVVKVKSSVFNPLC